jgi:hypothetical protein
MTSCHTGQHPIEKFQKCTFGLLKEISKRVESVATKSVNTYQTFFIKALELKGLPIISVGWFLLE